MREKLYMVWANMLQRCTNANRPDFKYYGGRGITYDPLWGHFKEFKNDLGDSYQEGLSLDRIDVNGNYCKENCRWVPMEEQSRNKRVYINSPCGVSGVSAYGERWRARAYYKRKTHSLGVYSTKEEAIQATENFWETLEKSEGGV